MSWHTKRRRARQEKKGKKVAALNLVSLMDIFTILVFFLMVNSSEVEVLQTSSKIKLPDSTSEKQPKNQLMISVDEDDLVVQGRFTLGREGQDVPGSRFGRLGFYGWRGFEHHMGIGATHAKGANAGQFGLG